MGRQRRSVVSTTASTTGNRPGKINAKAHAVPEHDWIVFGRVGGNETPFRKMKAMKRRHALIMLVLGISGCASTPTESEIAGFDYGSPPDEATLEIQMMERLKRGLRDAETARFDRVGKPEKYWCKETGMATQKRLLVGWRVVAYVNAKNAYGAYIGYKRYDFFFRDGQCVSYKSTETLDMWQ